MNAFPSVRFARLRLMLCLISGIASLHAEPGLLSERWDNDFQAGGIDSLRKEINLRAPDAVSATSNGLSFVEVANDHGTRLRGWLVAPETGDYTFFVSADDQCELWLSSDDSPFNRELIAWSQQFTSTLWNKYPTQRSRSIHLQQGRSYYIEGLMANWGGSDYLALGWKRAPVAMFTENTWGGGVGTWTAAGNDLQFSARTGDLSGLADDALYRQRDWTGKGEFIVRLSGLNSPDPAGKAGLMMRAHSGANSRYGMVFKRADGTTAFQYRTLDGETTATIESGAWGEWLRFVKSGNELTASVSADRVTWTTIGSVTFASLPATYLVGTAASSNTGPSGAPMTGSFSSLEALNLQPGETIPGSALVQYTGHPDDLDGDALPDSWETASGLDANDPYGDQGAYNDPDGDYLNNWVEYRFGYAPMVADRILNTLLVERWDRLSATSIDRLVQSPRFYAEPDTRVFVAPADLKFPGVFFGSRIRGSITPAVSGNYTFWISARSSAEIWLSLDENLGKYAKQRIAVLSPVAGTSHGIGSGEPNLWDRFASQQSEVVHLEAGKNYHLEVLHESSFGWDAHASVAWARDGGPREMLPASVVRSYVKSADDRDDDCLADAWESQHGLDPADNGYTDMARQGERGDFDGDGLANREEFLLGTNPANRDSDGDGFTDFEETRTYQTDPLVSDAPSETVVGSVPVRNFAAASIGWTPLEGGIVPNSFRGTVEWDFQVPGAGIWILQLATRLRGELFSSEEVDVKVFIDGRYLGRYLLRYGNHHEALLRVITPALQTGSHRLKLDIDNLIARRNVGIESLEIRRATGADLDGDGIVDWIETIMAEADRITDHAPASRISPFCLEGTARLAEEVQVNGFAVAKGTGDTHWYYNLHLDPDQPTSCVTGFPSGLTESTTISWQATNVMDGGEMLVRVGDSLKLGAWTGHNTQHSDPGNSTEGAGSAQITVGAATYHVVGMGTAVHTFTAPGTWTVSASRNGLPPVTLVVKVLHANLPDDTLALQNNLRYFNLTTAEADPALVFQPGENLRLGARETLSPTHFRFQLYPGKGGRLGVAARLWDGGPIADVASILSSSLSDALQNGVTTSEFADEFPGYIIVKAPMVVTDLPAGGTVKITIFRAGVMFLDGSTVKTLGADDFENGIVYLEFLFPRDMGGGYCHYIDVYDANNTLLGRR